jgi:ubiquinone biosynthesis protein COQ4
MALKFIEKARMLKALAYAIADPNRTDEIFKVIGSKLVVNEEAAKCVVTRLMSHPKSAAMLESRFLGKWDLDELLKLPQDSLGYIYAKHMRDNKLDPDFYPGVPGNSLLAYVQMRGRQTHDIWHVLTGFNTDHPGEAGEHAFVQAQFGGRVGATIAGIFLLHGALYQPKLLPDIIEAIVRGCNLAKKAAPLFGEKFEDNWGRNMQEYQCELGLI